MPRKKATRKKSPVRQALPRLQVNLKSLRRDVETLISRGRKQATQLVTRDQKQAMQRLVNQAQELRADFDKRVQRASKDLEARSRRFFSTLEKEAEKRLERIVHRLVGPSRREVQDLSRRVHDLEQILKQRQSAETTPSAPPELAAPSIHE
jgi:F0F1-type ATP synthase membrane subunit b/b'